MKLLFTIITLMPLWMHSQNPSFSLGANSKYYDFKKTHVSDDFKQVSQVRVGTYMTLGNFGLTNSSWIGSNVLLDYSSYGGVGSLGNKNYFKPVWTSGTALVIELDYSDGKLKGFNHNWGGLTNRADFLDFEQIWELGNDETFFLSNVGIGTTTPDSKLTVKGKVHAEEVKVDLSVPGPDYVFKEGYNLRSLEEVQDYINKNGHLPNIPSAKEMETDGVELGIMNMKLLEKIEELTLYILELKEENRKQKSISKQLIQLQARLEKLESKN